MGLWITDALLDGRRQVKSLHEVPEWSCVSGVTENWRNIFELVTTHTRDSTSPEKGVDNALTLAPHSLDGGDIISILGY